MENRINTAAVLFGNFEIIGKGIQEEVAGLQELLNSYNMFGSLGQELSNDGPTMPIISFASSAPNTKDIRVKVEREKLTIVSVCQADKDGQVPKFDEDTFISVVKDIQKKILLHYKIKGTRISYVVAFSMKGTKQITDIRDKVLADKYLYNVKDTFDWGVRAAVKDSFNIHKGEELVNIVTSLDYAPDRTVMPPITEEGADPELLYMLEINTVAENKQTRIDEAFIDEFYEQAKNKLLDIRENYEK